VVVVVVEVVDEHLAVAEVLGDENEAVGSVAEALLRRKMELKANQTVERRVNCLLHQRSKKNMVSLLLLQTHQH